jgi:hypothetical protein
MKRKVLWLTLFLMFLLGGVERVSACSCVRNISTCQRYASSAVIFIGKAVEVKQEPRGDNSAFNVESTVFEVEEMFLGQKKERITVRNKSGFSCDTEFERGETYVIFAGGDEKEGYGTGVCSGNTPIADAAEILDDLRALPKPGTGGRLFGRASESLKKRVEESIPLPGVKIKVQEVGGKRKIYNAVTDEDGNYELIVPAGRYRIVPAIPAYAAFGYINADAFTVRDRGCVEESFSLENKSQISGRVIDADGKPVAGGKSLTGVRLELFSADLTGKPTLFEEDGYASIKEDGTFTINNIPAGKYTLSVNYAMSPGEDNSFPTVFYPGSPVRSGAKIFEVGLGQNIGGIVFRLPPRLAEITVRGAIVFEDGTPAAAVDLHLEDAENPGFCVNGCVWKTDAEGNFTLKGYATRQYRIKARTRAQINGDAEYSVESEQFSLDENIQQFKLTLKKTEKPQ